MDLSSVKVMGVIVVLTAILCGRVAAQSSGCTNVLLGLMPCLSFVSGESSTPSASCCSQLANVVTSQPRCLCLIVNSGSGTPLGFTINQTRALELPATCQVPTPLLSNCNAGSPQSPPGSTWYVFSANAGGSKVTPLSGTTSSRVLPATTPGLHLMFLSLSLISSDMAFGNS